MTGLGEEAIKLWAFFNERKVKKNLINSLVGIINKKKTVAKALASILWMRTGGIDVNSYIKLTQ